MQIGQLNNLIYPDFGSQSATASPAKDTTVRPTPAAQDAPGVVATIQSTSDTAPAAPVPADLVYSNGSKANAASDTDADAARASEQYRQAVARSADSPSSLSLDKDGVLVSRPATQDSSSQAFVTFAVNTMRQYADEQERQKSRANDTQAEGSASRIPRSLGDVQKLASRFKLFA